MRVELLFEPRDLWIGVYWNYVGSDNDSGCGGWYGGVKPRLDVYICVVPMIPLRLTFCRAE